MKQGVTYKFTVQEMNERHPGTGNCDMRRKKGMMTYECSLVPVAGDSKWGDSLDNDDDSNDARADNVERDDHLVTTIKVEMTMLEAYHNVLQIMPSISTLKVCFLMATKLSYSTNNTWRANAVTRY